MKNQITVALLFLAWHCGAQNFEKKFQMATPANFKSAKAQWADMDNDSLLDVVASGIVQNEVKIIFTKNQGSNSFGPSLTLSTGYQEAVFALADFDQDGKIDVIISGQKNGSKITKVLFNNGSFDFSRTATLFSNQAFSDFIFADLNNDGVGDLVASDNSNLYLFEQKGGQFILRKDSAIAVSSINVFDFDNNGFPDISFSGMVNQKPLTAVLFLQNKFKTLKKSRVYAIDGELASGDLTQDGLFDAMISGRDSTGAVVITTFMNQGNSFQRIKKTPGFDSVSMKIADFTSDGKADVAFFAKSFQGNKGWIKTSSGDSVAFASAYVRSLDYGDYDDDGDLDMVQLRDDSVTIFNNHLTAVNQGPSIVGSSIGVQLYDRVFFYWPKSVDDHTDNSISYDLAVYGGTGLVKSADFDRSNLHRLLVAHGNTGVANYSVQKLSGNLSYQIQSIDNSFAVQTKVVGGGSCRACANITTENVTLCSAYASVQLEPLAPQAMWFSFNKGFLGIHDNLSYAKSESDTIFSFNPNNLSCASIKLFRITVASTDTIKSTRSIWNCQNSENVLTVPSEWLAVTWKSNPSSGIFSGNQRTITLTAPISFTALGSNDLGCTFKEVFDLHLSKPDLHVADSQYQIAEGSSVQLIANGGGSYLWSPPDGLSDPTISSPIASPLHTTKYVVIAKDSLQCTASADVLVEVMEAGFIPTLFTPNGDGKNDALKIFGLTSASNFRFTIYNREGSIMFETKDIATAVYLGWSGLTNGQSQPPGTYYWKVEGDNDLGAPITLNGKKSGAFLLVR